ncbi:Uncharacterised protein [Escherichia coli]|uniref:Uncharacterized protein n=1 Tax=Escherichia coli TaxID=562 RepID=A0A377A2Q3_ECOLX|nr:Uncharacterised protein [Escherichia coli]
MTCLHQVIQKQNKKFIALENTLNAARPHLGELYEAYKTTLTDMKPEYIGS